MFCKKNANKIFLAFLIMVPLCVKGQDSIKAKEGLDKSIEIVLDEIENGGRLMIKSRHIFVLLEEKEFNLEKINKLFDEFKKLYPEPYNLRITMYSSKEMLQRLIDFKKMAAIEFSEDEKGREAARKYYEKYYPLPDGYFRADYFRYGKFEFFDYSPKKEDSKMIRVSLKEQTQTEKPVQ